ncbi:hypothetical protein N9937_00580 [bacterium]|nr:hypothetical protein [bacterium]
MTYKGDFNVDDTVGDFFTTSDKNGGAIGPSSALEAADVNIYKNNSATQRSSTSGITMTSPFDSVTGLHHINIDLSDNTDAGFWAAGNDYSVVLKPDETVDSETVVSEILTFSIENRSSSINATGNSNRENFFDGTGYAGTNNVIPTVTTLTGHTAQTGDNYARIGAPDGASVSADVAAVKADTAATLEDTADMQPKLGTVTDLGGGATLGDNNSDLAGATFSTATDSQEAIRDRGDAAWTTGAGGSDRLLMVDTTIATLASQTSFTLTSGSADDDAYNNCTIVIEDVSTSVQKAVGIISDYIGASKTVTLKYDPAIFTIATTDKVYILAENALKSTLANRQLDVTAAGNAGIDWANVENPTTALDLSGTDIQLVDTVTLADTVTDVTNQVSADVTAISGDATAADNLESQYDTTGLTGDSFPATQSQVGNISTGAGGLSTIIDSYTPAGTETQTNTYTSTQQGDGTYHIVQPGAGSLDFYYETTVSAGGKATAFNWLGYIQSNGDTVGVYYWDWVGSAYVQITTLNGSVGTTPSEEVFSVPIAATGTGANNGKVRLRFESSGGSVVTNVATDVLLCEFSQASQTVGYANGAIWIDTALSNTNTVDYVDGTADNKVSTWAAALTLSASLSIKKFQIANGSTITLSANSDNYTLIGDNWTLALNGQSIAGAHFHGASVSGTSTGVGSSWVDCDFGASTLAPASFTSCGFGVGDGLFTGDATGDYIWNNCYSVVAGTGSPDFIFSGVGATVGLNNRGWKGGVAYTLDSDCTLSHEVLAGGGTTITPAGATVEIRGLCRAITLALADTDAGNTLQVIANTGPVIITSAGSSDSATINLYGSKASIADASNGTTNDFMILKADIDAILVDTADMQPKLGTPADTDMSTDIANVQTTADAIETDTQDLQTQVGTAGAGLTDLGGMSTGMKAEVEAEATDALNAYDPPTKAELDAGLAALNDLSAAQINAEVVDVLFTDTIAELAQAKPAATPTIATGMMLMYMAMRNKFVLSTTEMQIHNDAGTVIAKKAVADSGSAFTESEAATGP